MSGKLRWVGMGLLLMVSLGAGCGPSALLIQPVSREKKLTETVIRGDNWFVSDKIAVIDVDGVLVNAGKKSWLSSSDNPVSLFVEKLEKAEKDNAVKAVVLRLNSLGGSVGATDTMYHKLREFKRKSRKPVIACMPGVYGPGYPEEGADR